MNLSVNEGEMIALLVALEMQMNAQISLSRWHRQKARAGAEWFPWKSHEQARKDSHRRACELRGILRKARRNHRGGFIAEIPKPAIPAESQTSQGESTAVWHPGEAPHDREVIIMGNLMWHGECECWAEPFCARAIWREDATVPGWHYATGDCLSVRQTLEDELVIHYWSELPYPPENEIRTAVRKSQEVAAHV